MNGGTLLTSAAITSGRTMTLNGGGGTFNAGTFNTTWNGVIGGGGSLTKTGTGTLALSGANTWSGGTTVSAGTLTVNSGSRIGTGAFALSSGTVNLNNAAQTVGNFTSSSGTLLNLGAGHTLTIQQTGTTTAAGTIAGTGGLRFTGSGRLTVSAANTYSGNTVLEGGAMVLSNPGGSALGSGSVTVRTAGILAGSGSVSGATAIQSGGTVSPGAATGPATLTLGTTTLASSGALAFEINDAAGVAGTAWDFLTVNGAINITATPATPFQINVSSLTLAKTAGPAANFNTGDTRFWTLATASGGISGFAADRFSINLDGFLNANDGLWYVTSTGTSIELAYSGFTPVPEPSSWAAIAGSGLLVWAIRRRRVRR